MAYDRKLTLSVSGGDTIFIAYAGGVALTNEERKSLIVESDAEDMEMEVSSVAKAFGEGDYIQQIRRNSRTINIKLDFQNSTRSVLTSIRNELRSTALDKKVVVANFDGLFNVSYTGYLTSVKWTEIDTKNATFEISVFVPVPPSS